MCSFNRNGWLQCVWLGTLDGHINSYNRIRPSLSSTAGQQTNQHAEATAYNPEAYNYCITDQWCHLKQWGVINFPILSWLSSLKSLKSTVNYVKTVHMWNKLNSITFCMNNTYELNFKYIYNNANTHVIWL